MSHHTLCTKPNIQNQRGQTCKLYALSNAMEWLSDTYSNQNTPHQVRKNNKGIKPKNKKTISIRQRAKEMLGSKVGEVYGDLNLIKLAKDNGFDNFKSISCSTIAEYCAIIKSAIDKNLMPLVFFDVNVSDYNQGQPYNSHGSHEHAAVVYGYYHTPKGELKFQIGQWGKFYDFSAVELAISNFQLSKVRKAEKFIKFENRWVNAEDVNMNSLSPAKRARGKLRQALNHNLKKQGTFKQRVIIGAPNGIAYQFNLQNVKANSIMGKKESKSFKGYLLAALMSSAVVSYFMIWFVPATTYALCLAATASLSILSLFYAIWRKSNTTLFNPVVKENLKKPILEVDFKSISRLPKPVSDQISKKVRDETAKNSKSKNALLYSYSFDKRKSKEEDNQSKCEPQSKMKIVKKMPLSQPF